MINESLFPSFKINATTWGDKIARRLFESRGNHSEIQIKEKELAVICSTAFAAGQDAHIAEGQALKKYLATGVVIKVETVFQEVSK